jgi:regulatory protein
MTSPVRHAQELEDAESWVVTGVVSDPRTPGYEVIELNETRFASLPSDLISKSGIQLGTSLDPTQFRGLSEAADLEAASRVAVRLLAARPRTELEMRRALRDRGHRPLAIDSAVQRLSERDLLNDAEYARNFARIRCEKGHGRSRIVADLRAKGVHRQIAEAAATEVLEGEGVDALEQARQLAVKRLGQLTHVSNAVRRRRVLSFLGRRGYHGWEVREMLDELIDQY